MSDKWYPVIDYSICDKCGYCIYLCPQEAYDINKSPEPVLLTRQKCIEGCKYCGVMCPKGAIRYSDSQKEYTCSKDNSCGCCI